MSNKNAKPPRSEASKLAGSHNFWQGRARSIIQQLRALARDSQDQLHAKELGRIAAQLANVVNKEKVIVVEKLAELKQKSKS